MIIDDAVCIPHTVRAVLQIERTHPRLEETTQSARVHIEKRESGQQHHPRITIQTQPRHRVTVNCDSIIAVGDAVVCLS